MKEEEIIMAVLGGDTNQYAYLVERYWVGLVIYCDRILTDRDEAEDVAQKAFIKSFDQLAKYNAKQSHFSTWLYRIAKNLSIDHLRAHKRTVPTLSEDIETLDPAFIDNFEHKEIIDELRTAIKVLEPKEQREAIQAYYWHGKSYQAIADEMDVPINTVKTWMHRAKRQLRSQLS